MRRSYKAHGFQRTEGRKPRSHNLQSLQLPRRLESRKKLSAIFPGCRQNLNWLIRRFFVEKAEPRAGGDPPALAVMEYVLLTVRSWDVDEVNSPRRLSAKIIVQNFLGLKEALDGVLVKVRIHCPDTATTIGYAR